MRGIVYGLSFEDAELKMDEILRGYEICNISPIEKGIRRSKNYYEVRFENGDFWRAIKASASACGTRCNVAYIDRNIPTIIQEEVILPCLYSLPLVCYTLLLG